MTEQETPIVLNLSRLPSFVLAEGEASTIGPALTGAVILRAIVEGGLVRTPSPAFEGSWTQFMPRPLLDSIGDGRIAVLEESQRMLKRCDLGMYDGYRGEVAAHLSLLHDEEIRRSHAA